MTPGFFIEKHGPMGLGIAAAAAHYLFFRQACPDDGEIFGNVTNVSGIAVGFLATAQGLLVSMSETHLVTQLKQLHQYKPLLRYFSRAIQLALVLCLGSLLLTVAPVHEVGVPRFAGVEWAFSLWIGWLAWTASASFRVIHLFGRVIHES